MEEASEDSVTTDIEMMLELSGAMVPALNPADINQKTESGRQPESLCAHWHHLSSLFKMQIMIWWGWGGAWESSHIISCRQCWWSKNHFERKGSNLTSSFPTRATEAQKIQVSCLPSSQWVLFERFCRNHSAILSYPYVPRACGQFRLYQGQNRTERGRMRKWWCLSAIGQESHEKAFGRYI